MGEKVQEAKKKRVAPRLVKLALEYDKDMEEILDMLDKAEELLENKKEEIEEQTEAS